MPEDRPQKSFVRLCTTLPLLTGMLGAAVLMTVPFLPASYGIVLTAAGVVALVGLPCAEWYLHRREIRAWTNVERQLTGYAEAPEDSCAALQPIHVGTEVMHGWNRLAQASQVWSALEHLEQRVADRLSGSTAAGGTDEILDSLGEGVGVTDLDGRLTLLNTALAAILGGSQSDEFLGDDLIERLSGIAGGSRELTQRRALTGVPVSVDLEHDEGGSRQFLRCARRPQLNDASEVVGHVWSVRDVTQQRSAEESREQFISTASHELRTPLANIKAYAETLELAEEIDREEQKDFLNTINTEATRLGRFVDELLDVTRMQCGSLTLDRRETDLERLVQDASGKVAAEAARKKIRLSTEIPRSCRSCISTKTSSQARSSTCSATP